MIREHWEGRFKKRFELSLSKKEDYGSKDIPNGNFHRIATLCRILKVDTTTPKGVAQFHIAHKLDRICNLLRDGRVPNNESVEDTLADMQNYIDILQDILQEGGTTHSQESGDQVNMSGDEFAGRVSMGVTSIPNLTLPKEDTE